MDGTWHDQRALRSNLPRIGVGCSSTAGTPTPAPEPFAGITLAPDPTPGLIVLEISDVSAPRMGGCTPA